LMSGQTVFFMFAGGTVVAAGCAKTDSPCHGVNEYERFYGLILAAAWLLCNARFLFKVRNLRAEQSRPLEELPPTLNRRRSSVGLRQFKQSDALQDTRRHSRKGGTMHFCYQTSWDVKEE